jgi:3-oxoadipate enol-lactonase
MRDLGLFRRSCVEHSGVAIHVADHMPGGPSDEPPVLLLHGLLTSGEAWHRMVPALTRRRRVIVPDLRGHGRSSAPSGDVNLDELVGDLLAVLDALGVRRATLLGLSLGGLVCLHAALRAPERVAALGLLATPASPETRESRMRRLGTLEAMDRIGKRPVLRGMAGWLFGHTTRRRVPQVVEAWIEAGVRVDATAVRRTAQAALWRPEVRPSLGRVRVPTLVVAGAEDAVLPREEAQLLARGIPGATSCTLAHAGHLLPLEQPDVLATVVRSWLAFVDGTCGPVEEGDHVRAFA